MKTLKSKFRRKKNQPAEPTTRITNETVAEHREQILAGGRKFKYPVQYARHKLVINTIIISVVVISLAIFTAWWQLYPSQNTSPFFYRITQLTPLPVAEIDGYPVRYSNYLMKYRSSIHYIEQQRSISSIFEEGERQRAFYKRQALNEAIADAYAAKLADTKNIAVSDQEIAAFIKRHRESQRPVLSLKDYERVVLQDFFGWSLGEYRLDLKNALLRQKVSFAVDSDAQQRLQTIKTELAKPGALFEEVAGRLSEDEATKKSGGDVGFVPKNNQDENGLASAALSLKVGETSKVIEGTDGYFIVRLLEINDAQLRYGRIKVTLKIFNSSLADIRARGAVKEYINVPVATAEPIRQ